MAVLSKPMAVLSSFINNGRFIKVEDGQWPQWPFYQSEAAKWPDRAADGRFHIATYKEFIGWGWPDGLPETSFRATQNGRMLEAAAAYAARSLCRNTGGPDYGRFGRNGRFINQKRTNGQISSFGLRIADFILSRRRSLSAARPSNF